MQAELFMKRGASLFLTLVLAFATLPGCASKYGQQKTVVNYYPACYSPIQDLRSREHDVAKTTAGGAVVGALGGALIGLLATGKAEGALAGGMAGGMAGAVAGNIYASKQKEADDNRRLVSYLQDMDGDISNMDIDAAAAKTSFNCYERAFQSLIAEIKERRISPEAARARYAEIRSGEEEAAAIYSDLIVRSQDLQTQYEQAFNQEERVLSSPRKMAQGNVRQKAIALNHARGKNKVFATKKQQFSAAKSEADDTIASQDRQILASLQTDRDNIKL